MRVWLQRVKNIWPWQRPHRLHVGVSLPFEVFFEHGLRYDMRKNTGADRRLSRSEDPDGRLRGGPVFRRFQQEIRGGFDSDIGFLISALFQPVEDVLCIALQNQWNGA